MSKSDGVSRRDFIRSAAFAGALAAGGGLLAACEAAGVTAAPTATPAAKPAKWDKEVDVIVVGSGTVSVAALAAAEAGASVLIIEKAPVFGGHSSISGGGLWTPNNHLMRKEALADSREEALAYLDRVVGNRSDGVVREKFVDTCNVMIDFLISSGVGPWKFNGGGTVFADYYPDSYPGHKKKGRVIQLEAGSGRELMGAIKKNVDTRKIEVMLETAAQRLVYEGDSNEGNGQVIGVVAQDFSKKSIFIKARKGVVIGTGGFDYNRAMTEHYLRNPIYYSCAAPTNTGDGHLMCMAVGAQMRNMNEVWGLVAYDVKEDLTGVPDWSIDRGKPGCIIVNRHGQRIGNESAAYENFARSFSAYDSGTIEWRNIPSYAIFDSGFAANYALPGSAGKKGTVPAFFKQADTLAGLAQQLGINAEGLADQVARFNKNAANGTDPEWHRGENSFDRQTNGDSKRTDIKNPNLAPVATGPFYGTAIWPGALGTNGGPRTNENGQVLNVWGKVIPRLYVTGNTMASVFGGQYPGGGATLGPGMTYAFIEGKHAAGLEPVK